MALVAACTFNPGTARSAEPTQPPAPEVQDRSAPSLDRQLDIAEYRVEGAEHLTAPDVEEAVGPFLGPGRTLQDIEGARAALERTYRDKGFQAVSVTIPPQKVVAGQVTIQVTEGRVDRLRVRGARWFSLREIKRQAPSMAPGQVPNFNDIMRDIAVLNQLPDRRITPSLRPGTVPGTVDVDLMVDDTLPLHGSLEIHNRHGANTTPQRVGGSLRYDNLWQAGHSLGLSFQTAPERIKDGTVLSAYYTARVPDSSGVSFSVNGILQDSDVSTLGSIAVQGRGRVLGWRAVFTLSGTSGFFDNLSVGFDYKRYQEVISLETSQLSSPITYWPCVAQYTAIWSEEGSEMQLVSGLTLNMRGSLSSNQGAFDNKRYRASGAFLYARTELSRKDEIAHGMLLVSRFQGQYTDDALIGSEQFTAGGSESVPGYLEAQATGDSGAMGWLELDSPSFLPRLPTQEWRVGLFAAGAWMVVNYPLPDQQPNPRLWSVGATTRLRVGPVHGEATVGFPMRTVADSRRYEPRMYFRVWAEF